ncbi:hypothetical protein J7L33_06535 [Candidatus Bathyarchaeota archaeon]|nr:hypothetical protein [Candidatus Bathyarchaeota archaeon]
MSKFVIVNYGAGNLRNAKRTLEDLKVDVSIANDLKEILKSDAIIFPGIGTFSEAVKNLLPIANKVKESIDCGKPIFGICLGLQILFTASQKEELNWG